MSIVWTLEINLGIMQQVFTERSHSGLVRPPRKRVSCDEWDRGFESRPLRHCLLALTTSTEHGSTVSGSPVSPISPLAPALDAYASRIEGCRVHVALAPYTTLRVGGPADLFVQVDTVDQMQRAWCLAHELQLPCLLIGRGSNLLVSDRGVRGVVIYNRCERIVPGELTVAETGALFRDVFLQTSACGLSGLEFAVGIPGTVGGALVSNAGAYRHCISERLVSLEIVDGCERITVDPQWMEFTYRSSRLRDRGVSRCVLLSATLRLTPDDPAAIRERARQYQDQRRQKQPTDPSAGSFFKNVESVELAQQLSGLPADLREAGVVPAGYLIAEAGLKGCRVGGACVSPKHANFIVNAGNATAQDIAELASTVIREVYDRFHVHLDREVLYVGDW